MKRLYFRGQHYQRTPVRTPILLRLVSDDYAYAVTECAHPDFRVNTNCSGVGCRLQTRKQRARNRMNSSRNAVRGRRNDHGDRSRMGTQRVDNLATAWLHPGSFHLRMHVTGIFIWIRFQYELSLLQRYYPPSCLRTETAGLTHPISQYQLLYVSDGEKMRRAALDNDLQPGSTRQFGGKPLPLMLTRDPAQQGRFHLMREGPLRTSPLSDNSTKTAGVEPRCDSLSRAYNIIVCCPKLRNRRPRASL